VYEYDELNQIKTVLYDVTTPEAIPGSPSRTVSYEWDAAGNRSRVTDNSITTNYTANNLNQYLDVGGSPLSYSKNGNLETETITGWTYSYDAQDRLVTAQRDTALVTFAYDPRNRRVIQTQNGTSTFLYYDDWSLIEERNSSDVLLEKYVHGPEIDELLKKVSQTSTAYYHQDALGSVTQLTDASGDLVEQYFYDVFGAVTIKDNNENIINASAFNNRFLFTGRELIIEKDIYDFRKRFYSSYLGRFLQPDRTGLDLEDYNLYRYVFNNPVNLTDPMGDPLLPAIIPVIINNPWTVSLTSSLIISSIFYFLPNDDSSDDDSSDDDSDPSPPIPKMSDQEYVEWLEKKRNDWVKYVESVEKEKKDSEYCPKESEPPAPRLRYRKTVTVEEYFD
jgi:RHS repeat-associated protein